MNSFSEDPRTKSSAEKLNSLASKLFQMSKLLRALNLDLSDALEVRAIEDKAADIQTKIVELLGMLKSKLESGYPKEDADLHHLTASEQLSHSALVQLPPGSQQLTVIMRELITNFASAAGIPPYQIDFDSDLDKTYGLDSFLRQDIIEVVLTNYPRFKFAGRELINLSTPRQFAELFARMDMNEQIGNLTDAALTPEDLDDWKPRRLIFEKQILNHNDFQIHSLPKKILLVGRRNVSFGHLIDALKGFGSTITELYREPGYWTLPNQPKGNEEDLQRYIQDLLSQTDRHMIIFANFQDGLANPEISDTNWSEIIKEQIQAASELVGAIASAHSQDKAPSLTLVSKDSDSISAGAAQGFFRALHQLYPEMLCTSLRIAGAITSFSARELIHALTIKQGNYDMTLSRQGLTLPVLRAVPLSQNNSQLLLSQGACVVLAGSPSSPLSRLAKGLALQTKNIKIVWLTPTTDDSTVTDATRLFSESVDEAAFSDFMTSTEELAGQCENIKVDFAQKGAVTSALTKVKAKYGKIHGYVHAIGGLAKSPNYQLRSEEIWKNFHYCTASLPELEQALAEQDLAFAILAFTLDSTKSNLGPLTHCAILDTYFYWTKFWREKSNFPAMSMVFPNNILDVQDSDNLHAEIYDQVLKELGNPDKPDWVLFSTLSELRDIASRSILR